MILSNKKSQCKYIGFFNMPFFPELYLSFNGYNNLKNIWRAHDDEEKEAYLSVFRQRGALRSALNWYRANVEKITPEVSSLLGDVNVPTVLIWGKYDPAIGRKGVEGTDKYMQGPYELIELDAGHWLIQEAFHDVSRAIVNHIETHSLNPEN